MKNPSLFTILCALAGSLQLASASEDHQCMPVKELPNGLDVCSAGGGYRLLGGTRIYPKSGKIWNFLSAKNPEEGVVVQNMEQGTIEIYQKGKNQNTPPIVTIEKDLSIKYANGVTRRVDGMVTIKDKGDKICNSAVCTISCTSEILIKVLENGTIKTVTWFKIGHNQNQAFPITSIIEADGSSMPIGDATVFETKELVECRKNGSGKNNASGEAISLLNAGIPQRYYTVDQLNQLAKLNAK